MRPPAHPLSLEEYRAEALATNTPRIPGWVDRPQGECAWIHLGDITDMAALLDLADRLQTVRGDLTVLMTRDPGSRLPWPEPKVASYVKLLDAPDEHPGSIAAFLDHWRPDVGLWVWGGLRPNLLDLSAARGIRMHLVSAEKTGFDGWRLKWHTNMAAHLASCFASASARSAGGARRVAKFGVRADMITLWPPLRPSGRVLPYGMDDLDELLQHLKGRPVWLGAEMHDGEWQQALQAHRIALRTAHRLLLVLNPANENDRDAIAAQLYQDGLMFATWSDGQYPEEAHQVLIADLPDELGLWFRAASVSCIGGTLQDGRGGMDPMLAASLGTGILFGPNQSKHVDAYRRLTQAGAAEPVQDAQSIGAAIARLTAPDQAAQMALAGWDVVTAGADTVDAVIDLVQESLDAGPAPRPMTSQ